MINNKPLYNDPMRQDSYSKQVQIDLAKYYKHMKSNSEAAHSSLKHLNNSASEISSNVYSNQNIRKHNKYSAMALPMNNSGERNALLLGNDFNTVKYSQSPFLNKLTNLKQKLSNKKTSKINLGKGHKSRNSMFPKSYTEVNEHQRREMEIYGHFNTNNIERIPEEDTFRRIEDSKQSNPYMNIEVENENRSFLHMATIKENKINKATPQPRELATNDNSNNMRLESDKKRAVSDTTRSKTGIDASDDTVHSNLKHLLPSAEKKVPNYNNRNRQHKQPHDYYQLDNNVEENKRGEIISILSMEINDTENINKSSHSRDSKEAKKQRKQTVINYFENQKTQKQNIKYLQGQFNVDDQVTPWKFDIDEIKIIPDRQLKSRHSKHRGIEYRERLDHNLVIDKGQAQTHRAQKHQYIRNNHDIITHHQRYKSSDSTDNSILKRSNGFEILYKRGEKLAKMLNHSESAIETPCSSSEMILSSNHQENEYSENQNESSSSEISEIKWIDPNFEKAGVATKSSIKDVLSLLK